MNSILHLQGVEPVLRTYNTLIIACNMCNQPREAMAVHRRMLDEGYTPNATTYNALISAYGKAGQLDKVMEVSLSQFGTAHLSVCAICNANGTVSFTPRASSAVAIADSFYLACYGLQQSIITKKRQETGMYHNTSKGKPCVYALLHCCCCPTST